MKISSTEFQQNVGYYLGLAEKGEEIVIEKKRPAGIRYKIKAEKINSKQNDKVQDLADKLEKFTAQFDVNDSVKYQRKYRS